MRLAGRFEPPPLALLLACALVGEFRAVVQPLVLTRLHTGHDRFLGGGIAPELIGDQHPRDVLQALEKLAKEPFGGFGIASTLDENVEGIALLVDGPPERVVLAIQGDDHFIQVPFIAPSGLSAAQLMGEGLAELQAPLPQGLVGYEDTPGGESFFDVPKAQGEAKIEPDRVGDNLGREAVTAIRIRGRLHSLLP